MQCEGINCRYPEMRAAHADQHVREVAQAIAHADDLRLLLVYARTAIWMTPIWAQRLSAMRGQMTKSDVGRANVIDRAVATWRIDLSQDAEWGARRGAVIERLTAMLVAQRIPTSDVREEERLIFTDGARTEPFDVLAAPAASTWEGIECKAGPDVPRDQARSLSWAAEHAVSVGDALVVVIASGAARTTLGPILRRLIDRPDLVRLVAGESFASLATATPSLTVAAA